MTYARARLWLGISSVGTLVVLSALALALDLPGRLLPAAGGPAVELAALVSCFGMYLLAQLPFDFLGGWLLPRAHGRAAPSPGEFVATWLRGVVVLGAIWTSLALLLLVVARVAGNLAAFGVVALATGWLVVAQARLARLVGGVGPLAGRHPADGASVWGHADPGFTGGWAGWPGREQHVLPAAWYDQLTPGELAAELARRRAQREGGGRARGVAMAAAFQLAGFALVAFGLRVPLDQLAGVVELALWMTLWSFAGVLLLPSLSRPAVYDADRRALESGIDATTLRSTIDALDRRQDDEPERAPGIEAVFHPIPAARHRAERLGHPGAAGAGTWHAARMALWLGWAGLGLLGRAVHCNCGRPELWVMLPAD